MPWIHNSDPLDFQSVTTPLSKNHFADPSWCPSETISWFVEGSGGESQSRTSLWNCSRRLTSAEGRLQLEVNTSLNQFRPRHIPKACRMLSMDVLPSNGQNIKRHPSRQSRKITHLPLPLSYYVKDHGPHSRSVQPLFELLPGSIDPTFGAQPQFRFPQEVSLQTSLKHIEQRQSINGGRLTESSLLYLFCGKSKH